MNNRRKFVIWFGVPLIALWLAGLYFGPRQLEAQLFADARPRWEAWHSTRVTSVIVDGQEVSVPSLAVYESGPVVRVEEIFSPIPMVFRCECEVSIHGVDGRGWVAWNLVTPWRIYEISGSSLWES